MICPQCDEKHMQYLPLSFKAMLSLFLDSSEVEKYRTSDDLYKNENSKYLAEKIFHGALNDDDMLRKLWEVNDYINNNKEVCSKCGDTILYNLYSNDSNLLFNSIKEAERTYILDYLEKKTGILKSVLSIMFKESEIQFDFLAIKVIKKFDIKLSNKLANCNETIRFFELDERGGDNYQLYLVYLVAIITGTLIPNILYDLSKYGFLKIFAIIRQRIVFAKTEKQARREIDSTIDKNNDLIKDTVLEGLTNKQRKKIVKKITKYTIKNKIRNIYNMK